jgi:hypothetical protein
MGIEPAIPVSVGITNNALLLKGEAVPVLN